MKIVEGSNYPKAEWEDGAAIAWAIVVIFCIVTIICSLAAAGNIITALLNPEYWALMELKK